MNMSTLQADQICEFAKRLKLSTTGVLESINNIDIPTINEETKIKVFSSFLEMLVQGRQEERCFRNKQQACFPQEKSLHNFNTDNIELPKNTSWDELISCDFIKQKKNIIMLGNPGTGKTHLAIALGIKACSLGYKPMFRTVSRLVDELTRAFEKGQHRALIKRIEQCDMLILDEMGYIPIPVDGTRLLFEVVAECYEKRSLIFTSNFPLNEWNRVMGDQRLTAAFIDRVIHHCILLEHGGNSYRLQSSLINQRGAERSSAIQ